MWATFTLCAFNELVYVSRGLATSRMQNDAHSNKQYEAVLGDVNNTSRGQL